MTGDRDYDQIRAEFPDFGLNVYAVVPGSQVTLEVIMPDGTLHEVTRPTLAEAMAALFPAAPGIKEPEEPAEPGEDVFA